MFGFGNKRRELMVERIDELLSYAYSLGVKLGQDLAEIRALMRSVEAHIAEQANHDQLAAMRDYVRAQREAQREHEAHRKQFEGSAYRNGAEAAESAFDPDNSRLFEIGEDGVLRPRDAEPGVKFVPGGLPPAWETDLTEDDEEGFCGC